MSETRQPVIDAHTHVFCWGENPDDGYLSTKTRESWLTRLLLKKTGIEQEPGDTLSEKMRHRLIRQLQASRLDYAVVLAQDAVYRADGSRDDPATHFYVSNDYVLQLAKDCPQVIPGCSINPIRKDAIAELERCHAAGGRLIKIHTAIQGVDPSRRQFDAFYRRAAELDIVLMFHTGYEHSCTVVSQSYTNPSKLARALDHGGTIVAAHCGTCAFFDPENYYTNFVRMMEQHENLYGDTAIMASIIRWNSLWRLAAERPDVKARILHGSDYPFPPHVLPYIFRVGWRPPERSNAFDLDLRIKETFDLGAKYTSLVADLLTP